MKERFQEGRNGHLNHMVLRGKVRKLRTGQLVFLTRVIYQNAGSYFLRQGHLLFQPEGDCGVDRAGLWVLTFRAPPVQVSLHSGPEDLLFGWSCSQKICQYPVLSFKTLLPKLGLHFRSLAQGGAGRPHLPGSTKNMELLRFTAQKELKDGLVLLPH